MASLELAFLLPLLAINACWILGLLSRRFKAAHDLGTFLLAFFLFWLPAPAPAAPVAPASPLLASSPAPASPPKQVAFWPGALDDPAQQPPRPFAWERRLPYCAPGPCSLDDPVMMAELREAAKRYVPRARPVKAVGVQHPRAVTPAAPPPPAVEPFDPVAWKARLDAFSAAIHMPNGSLLPDPKLVLAVAAPVQLPMPVQGVDIVQPAPTAAEPPPPASQKPKEADLSAPAPFGPATATTSAAERPQQLPPRSGPVTAPAKPPAATRVQPFRLVVTATKPAQKSSPAPPPITPPSGPGTAPAKPPAATPVQHFRLASRAVATTTKPAQSSSTAPAPPPPPPATNLPQPQRKPRETMEAAHELLGKMEAALGIVGGNPDTALGRAWQACLKPGAGDANGGLLLALTESTARILGEVLDPNTDRLDETRFPRADLARMGLKGAAFQHVVRRYNEGAMALRRLEGYRGWSARSLENVAVALLEVANKLSMY